MSRSLQSWLGLGLALLLVVLALVLHLRPAPEHLALHTVAPPLTRLTSLGDQPLDSEASPPARTPGPPRAFELRLLVEADAAAIAETLGPERATAAVALREDLSIERETWGGLVTELERRAAEAP